MNTVFFLHDRCNYCCLIELKLYILSRSVCLYISACGSTCEVFLSELDQWKNHAVSHLGGQLRVKRVQLDHKHTQKRKKSRMKYAPLEKQIEDFNLSQEVR